MAYIERYSCDYCGSSVAERDAEYRGFYSEYGISLKSKFFGIGILDGASPNDPLPEDMVFCGLHCFRMWLALKRCSEKENINEKEEI